MAKLGFGQWALSESCGMKDQYVKMVGLPNGLQRGNQIDRFPLIWLGLRLSFRFGKLFLRFQVLIIFLLGIY